MRNLADVLDTAAGGLGVHRKDLQIFRRFWPGQPVPNPVTVLLAGSYEILTNFNLLSTPTSCTAANPSSTPPTTDA